MSTPKAIRLTSLETGIATDLCSVAVACDFLHRSGGYLKWKMFGDDPCIVTSKEGESFNLEVIGVGQRRDHVPEGEKRPKRVIGPHPEDDYFKNQKVQLCTYCARAVGFCSWSQSLTPIEGWEAKRTVLGHGTGCSWKVIKCPLYIQDASTKESRRIQRQMLLEERRNNFELQRSDRNDQADHDSVSGREQCV